MQALSVRYSFSQKWPIYADDLQLLPILRNSTGVILQSITWLKTLGCIHLPVNIAGQIVSQSNSQVADKEEDNEENRYEFEVKGNQVICKRGNI